MSLRQYVFSKILASASQHHEPLIAEHKRRLFANLEGRVLEIGPGAGINFQYFPPGLDWTGYEPNPYLARQIQHPNLIQSPFTSEAPNSFDFAISTLVLCSVNNPAAVLKGIYQVLKPNGALLYLEHVAAPPNSPLAKSQHRWQPIWRCLADGCHPTRHTSQAIEAAGFTIEGEDRFDLPLWLASPHICGIARKINN